MSSATPVDVLARCRHLTLNGDANGLADLYAPDAVIEFSFADHRVLEDVIGDPRHGS